MSRVTGYGTAIIVVHGLVLAVHDMGHRDLQIFLPMQKIAYGYVVMVAAPVIATILLCTKWRRQRRDKCPRRN